MRYIISFLLFISISLCFAQWPVVRVQDDWHVGSGQTDTTDNWQYRFHSSAGVNFVEYPLYLLANPDSTVYTDWTAHDLPSDPDVSMFSFCVYTADVTGDGNADIIANIADVGILTGNGKFCYYEYISDWNYNQVVITTYSCDNTSNSAAYPVDVDGDGDIDIITGGIGEDWLSWWENNLPAAWTEHVIYDPADPYIARNIDVADADGDGFLDVLVCEEILEGWIGSVYYLAVYWGNTWTRTAVRQSDAQNYWRAMWAEMTDDALLDIAAVCRGALVGDSEHEAVVIALNPGRTFTDAFTVDPTGSQYYDGMWTNDFDGDGDMDAVFAAEANLGGDGQFELIQNDPAGAMSHHILFTDPGSDYGDGAIMHDMDGDGMMDIVGVHYEVGYYRRTGPLYSDFTCYNIGAVPHADGSHWVYPFNMDRADCSGDQDLDLLITYANQIRLYENRMIKYYLTGDLLSSSLGIPLPEDTCVVCSLFWEGCRIDEYTVTIDGRIGTTLEQCTTEAWLGNSTIPYHEEPHGWYIGEFHTRSGTTWVQYQIDFSRTGDAHISPNVDSIWVELYPISCECDSILADWICPDPCFQFTACDSQTQSWLLWSDTPIDISRIYFTIDDGTSSWNLSPPSTNLFISCINPACDSVFLEVRNYGWTDGATVTISLDSAYTTDGCFTEW